MGAREHDSFFATRQSLVERLANWNDQRNWQRFFDAYWKLIYSVARKAGLSDAEAQDVVQETVLTVAKNAERLKYDPAVGSFKGWLLNITRWRIADQFRKRENPRVQQSSSHREGERTDTIERVPDPAGVDLDAAWENEWQQNLLDAAMQRVRKKVSPKQYQIFDCYVVKQWPVQKVTSELRVSAGQVYLARHRISALIKKEIEALETKMV